MIRMDIEHDKEKKIESMHLIVKYKKKGTRIEEKNKVPLRAQFTFITLVCT
jgi:hypothetical protein